MSDLFSHLAKYFSQVVEIHVPIFPLFSIIKQKLKKKLKRLKILSNITFKMSQLQNKFY